MKIFISINLPQEIKNKLYEIPKIIGKGSAKIRFVPKKNYHCTMKFLGETTEEKLNEVIKKLSKINFKSFKIKIYGMGVFPDYNSIKIIWIGIQDTKELLYLYNAVDSETLNFTNSYMKYNPHITIGRVITVKSKNSLIKKINEIKFAPMEFEVKDFCLCESITTKDGVNYKTLKRFSLI